MWKKLDEITAHNQAMGHPDRFDPFEPANTVFVRVDGISLEGDQAVLIGCCESMRIRAEDVTGWRIVEAGPGAMPSYEVRLRKGARVIVQRGVVVGEPTQPCRRCGRQWTGPAKMDDGGQRGFNGQGHGHNENRGHGHIENCGHGHNENRGHGHIENRGHGHGYGHGHGHGGESERGRFDSRDAGQDHREHGERERRGPPPSDRFRQ
jgi:hypothetical protein